MAEVSSNDIKLAMVDVSAKSCSVYRSVQMLYKCIFYNKLKELSSAANKAFASEKALHRIRCGLGEVMG